MRTRYGSVGRSAGRPPLRSVPRRPLSADAERIRRQRQTLTPSSALKNALRTPRKETVSLRRRLRRLRRRTHDQNWLPFHLGPAAQYGRLVGRNIWPTRAVVASEPTISLAMFLTAVAPTRPRPAVCPHSIERLLAVACKKANGRTACWPSAAKAPKLISNWPPWPAGIISA